LEKTLEVDNYEHNLQMHYEAKRKELDILLTSSIPIQLSNMKTLLWINFLMIGLIFQFIKKFPLPDIITGFFVLSFCAILSIMIAMLTNRAKSYGVSDDLELMSKYESHEWTKSSVILDMMHTIQISIIDNRNVISNRAKLMHIATLFTIVSMIFISLTFTLKNITL